MYEELLKELKNLIGEEKDFIANAGNCATLLKERLEDINWIGFYMYSRDKMLLGPFVGKPACTRLPIGKGVVGNSADQRLTLIVPNVHEYDGHIVCDKASNSELVVPMIHKMRIYGVIDVDSPSFDRFTEEDARFFEELAMMLLENADLERLRKYYILAH